MTFLARLAIALLAMSCSVGSAASPDASPRIIFKNVRVMTMDQTRPVISSGHVIVEGDSIVAVGEGEPASGATGRVIDGKGATLMPGLADMHVHYWTSDDGILYLANGITTVRNLTGATGNVRLDQMARDGALAGPRVYTSGPLMDGDPPIRPGGLVITTPEQAVVAVRAQWAGGFPSIKLYERLLPDVYRAAVSEAKTLGMKVFTHTPARMTVAEVLALKVDTIEHMDGYSTAVVPDGFVPTQRFPWSEEWANGDPAKFAGLVAMTKEAGTALVPTIALQNGYQYSADPQTFFARPEMRYLSPTLRDGWRSSIADWLSRFYPYLAAERRTKLALVKAMYDGGVPLLIGTDPPNPFVIPGFAIHDELAGFVESGIGKEETLRIATRGAALFLGREKSGIVAPGNAADLVLVRNDPVADLTVLKRPLGVMVAGHWYDRAALDLALEERAAKVAAGKIPY